MHYVSARWVSDGDWAYIRLPTKEKPGQALRVRVNNACGNVARVENIQHGVNMWVEVQDLFVPHDDPRSGGHICECRQCGAEWEREQKLKNEAAKQNEGNDESKK